MSTRATSLSGGRMGVAPAGDVVEVPALIRLPVPLANLAIQKEIFCSISVGYAIDRNLSAQWDAGSIVLNVGGRPR
jgi:hypothetical protein